MWSIEETQGALYPTDEPGALGLLFAIDLNDGERVTAVADPEWMRTAVDALTGFRR